MSVRSEFVRLWNEFMADAKKISELPDASTPLTGTEQVELNQGGTSVKTAVSNLPSGGGGGSVNSVAGTTNRITSSGGANPVINIDAAYDAAITASLALKENLYRTFDRKIANYPLVLADATKGIEMNLAGANTVTVPLNATQAFPIGTLIPIVQYGAGLTSIVATGGVTINDSAGNLDSPGQYAPMFLRKIATDEWYLWNGTPGGAGSGQVNTVVGSTFIDVDATDPVNPVVSLDATGTPSSSTFLRGDNTWATPAGSGDVVGPASATSGVPVLFNGTTGKLIMNSVPTGTGSIPVMSVSPTFTGTPLAPTAAVGTNTTQIASTAYVQANALVLKSSLIYPTFNAYAAAPISVLGNGQANLEFINLGNLIGNTEDRNLVPGGFYRAVGSILMSRNTIWSTANSRWEYSFSTADGYGACWVECGGEGVNFMAAPVGVHPPLMPTAGMNFSIRAGGLRSTASALTYCNQTLTPFGGVYESVASGLPQWSDTGGTQPIIFAIAEEAKGTGGAIGNFYEAESHGSSYGGFRFLSSNGTKNSPSNSSTNKVVGSVYSTPYGGAYRRTAEMQFITRGTVSGSAVGQSMLFRTSPDTDANIADRFEITYDGLLTSKIAPLRFDYTSITTIPSYSTNYTPNLSTGTVGQIQQLSTGTGGLFINGFSTTSTAATAHAIFFRGLLGATAPTASSFVFQAGKHNAGTSFAALAATEFVMSIRNDSTDLLTILGNGSTTVGSFASAGVRINTSGTIQLVNSGSAAVIGVGGSANYTYTDKNWQVTRLTLTTSPGSAATSAPYIDGPNQNMRFFGRPGSSGSIFSFITHTDTFDATTLASTTTFLSISGYTMNPVSGSATLTGLLNAPTINTTAAYTNGKFIGYDYNPTLTSVTGLTHVAMAIRSGMVGIGAAASPTALLHLGPVVAALSSFRIEAGATTVAPSSPLSGDIWHQGTNNRLMFYKGASSQEFLTIVQVNSVSPTAPNRTIQFTHDGTTYYIAAKTTND